MSGDDMNDEERERIEDIVSMVKRGLEEQVQKALDAVRVIGNNAVHPGHGLPPPTCDPAVSRGNGLPTTTCDPAVSRGS